MSHSDLPRPLARPAPATATLPPVRCGDTIQVLIGQAHLCRPPHRLYTVLGSCIGLVLHDPRSGLAGMAHILLPDSHGRPDRQPPAKYADHAVDCLLGGLVELGARTADLRASLAGGARLFARVTGTVANGIGEANATATLAQLEAAGIPVVWRELGGACGRKMWFDPATGSARVVDLPPQVV